MKFTKMHGLGNDYVYINCFEESVADPPALARRIADRHLGVGSDGLILIQPSSAGDVRMEMYNADGSPSAMCGNGIRCVAKYAVEHGLAAGPEVRIETDCGVKSARCTLADGRVTSVCIDMGRPVWDAASIPVRNLPNLETRQGPPGAGSTSAMPRPKPTGMNACSDAHRIIDHPMSIAGNEFRVTCVSLGNPHAVVFVDDLATVDLETIGPLFEHAPQFPQRINVHFARVENRTHVTVRTWERGSGATRACGSGACAVCLAGAITNRTDRAVTTHLPGGNLFIEWTPDDHVHLTGPAVEVFTGEWP